MNRQLRRANEKSDKRREREQERRKEARRAARVVPAPRKSTPSTTSADPAAPKPRPAPGTRRQGLSVAYLVLTVGVILAQAFVPQRTDTLSLVVHGLFYIILGYFLALQLFRRGVARALLITVVAGVLLAALVEAAKLLTGAGAPEPLFIYLSLPGLLVGSWLGGFVHRQEVR